MPMSSPSSGAGRGDTFATGFAVASGAVALSALMYRLQYGKGGWPSAASDEQEEKEDVVADVPTPAKTGNELTMETPASTASTDVGSRTPQSDEWDGALDSHAETDMDVTQASDVDWLAGGAIPTSSKDEFNLEFERSSSNMSTLSALGRGLSDSSITNLIPSPRGWDTGAPVPIPGATDECSTTVAHGTKRPRTSSSPRFPQVKPEALPLDGPAPGSGEHMVDMVRHNQIPAGIIAKALPAELAFALLDSKNFEPGPRPALFDASKGQFLFKERTVNGKPAKPGGQEAPKADRWHNSGGIKGSRDMPPEAPLVRRRYGAVVQADGSKGFRYHEYTRVRIIEAPAADGSGQMERTVTEDRSEVLFHVMPKRTEKGRPSKTETEAPAKLWASLGVGLQQHGASVVPTFGNAAQPTVIRQDSPSGSPGVPPIPSSISPSGTSTPQPGSANGMPVAGENPFLLANPSASSVSQGRPILAMCAPPIDCVQAQYISFQKGAQVLGQISQTLDGRGVTLQSVGADVAEWHRVDPTLCPSNRNGSSATRSKHTFAEGELVGVHDTGLSRVTAGASVVGVISHQAIVTGGMPADGGEQIGGYESVAYVGRLPMRVRGAVCIGDVLIPSGLDDGVAVALCKTETSKAQQICAIVMGFQDKDVNTGSTAASKEVWVDACIVPPAVGSSMAYLAASLRQEAAARDAERDGQVAALAARLARLEASMVR